MIPRRPDGRRGNPPPRSRSTQESTKNRRPEHPFEKRRSGLRLSGVWLYFSRCQGSSTSFVAPDPSKISRGIGIKEFIVLSGRPLRWASSNFQKNAPAETKRVLYPLQTARLLKAIARWVFPMPGLPYRYRYCIAQSKCSFRVREILVQFFRLLKKSRKIQSSDCRGSGPVVYPPAVETDKHDGDSVHAVRRLKFGKNPLVPFGALAIASFTLAPERLGEKFPVPRDF